MIIFLVAKLNILIFAKAGDSCPLPTTSSFNFLSLPHWWQYLKGQKDGLDNCVPILGGFSGSGIHDLLAIGLAILGILLRLAGLITVVYVIIAGIQYILSSGNPEKTAAVLSRIINAAIGLAIVLTATAAVTFLGNSFK